MIHARCAVLVLLLLAIPPAAASQLLTLGSQRLHIDFAAPVSAPERDTLQQWLNTVAGAMTSIYGRLPLADIYVDIRTYYHGKEPVPWAQVNRGSRPGVSFWVDPRLDLQDYVDDWTAYHELSHLLIPHPGARGLWFSEGLASYYQNVVRARSGNLSALQAWRRLYGGFRRGAADTRMSSLTLEELSPRMRETGSFMRVYWSGAHYFFGVDLALRERGKSLDSALEQLALCCLNTGRRWNARSLAAQLDRLTDGHEFGRRLESTAASTALTNPEHLFVRYGFRIEGRQLFDEEIPPFVAAIMRPAGPAGDPARSEAQIKKTRQAAGQGGLEGERNSELVTRS